MGSSCLINTCFRTSTLTHSTNKHTQSCNSSSRNSQIFLFRKCKPLNASFDNLLHFPTCKQAFLLPLTASLAVLLCSTSAANAGILSGYTGMESVPGPELPKIEFLDRLNEENQKRYAENDARFRDSPVLKQLLEKSKLNKEKNKQAILDKYCLRGAEWGVGDCSTEGMRPDERDEFIAMLKKKTEAD